MSDFPQWRPDAAMHGHILHDWSESGVLDRIADCALFLCGHGWTAQRIGAVTLEAPLPGVTEETPSAEVDRAWLLAAYRALLQEIKTRRPGFVTEREAVLRCYVVALTCRSFGARVDLQVRQSRAAGALSPQTAVVLAAYDAILAGGVHPSPKQVHERLQSLARAGEIWGAVGRLTLRQVKDRLRTVRKRR